jgi:hypothetical protein
MDKSFLVLLFKKEQAFSALLFCKKEAKNFYSFVFGRQWMDKGRRLRDDRRTIVLGDP